MHCSIHLLLVQALLSITINAHMVLIKPPAIRWEGNPNTISPPDYDIKGPLLPNGSNFPCKGYLELFYTPEGDSVESWEAGSTQNFTTNGTSPHGGGSCQASISEDRGVTFKAIKSFIGGCPVPQKPFSFTVPEETTPGKVIFAWTWFAHTSANPEMYMNCAAVTITGTGGSGLSEFPDIFVANIGNGCTTQGNVAIPNPGGDVETAYNDTLSLPIGGDACPAVSIFVSSTSTSTTSTTPTTTPTTSAGSESTPTATSSNPVAPAETPTSAANPHVRVGIAGPALSVAFLVAVSIFSGGFS